MLYLAKQGCQNIDAFDLSENGIQKLKKLCGIQPYEYYPDEEQIGISI